MSEHDGAIRFAPEDAPAITGMRCAMFALSGVLLQGITGQERHMWPWLLDSFAAGNWRVEWLTADDGDQEFRLWVLDPDGLPWPVATIHRAVLGVPPLDGDKWQMVAALGAPPPDDASELGGE